MGTTAPKPLGPTAQGTALWQGLWLPCHGAQLLFSSRQTAPFPHHTPITPAVTSQQTWLELRICSHPLNEEWGFHIHSHSPVCLFIQLFTLASNHLCNHYKLTTGETKPACCPTKDHGPLVLLQELAFCTFSFKLTFLPSSFIIPAVSQQVRPPLGKACLLDCLVSLTLGRSGPLCIQPPPGHVKTKGGAERRGEPYKRCRVFTLTSPTLMLDGWWVWAVLLQGRLWAEAGEWGWEASGLLTNGLQAGHSSTSKVIH